jgi:hypothetical protein
VSTDDVWDDRESLSVVFDLIRGEWSFVDSDVDSGRLETEVLLNDGMDTNVSDDSEESPAFNDTME